MSIGLLLTINVFDDSIKITGLMHFTRSICGLTVSHSNEKSIDEWQLKLLESLSGLKMDQSKSVPSSSHIALQSK